MADNKKTMEEWYKKSREEIENEDKEDNRVFYDRGSFWILVFIIIVIIGFSSCTITLTPM